MGALVVRDGQLLMLRRAHVAGRGRWTPPLGHLRTFEHVERCAEREVLEETALTVKARRIVTVTQEIIDPSTHYVTVWVECDYVAGDVVLAAPREADQVGWFSLSALPRPWFMPFESLMRMGWPSA